MLCANYAVALAALITCVHGIGITVPGTNWCGPGDNADNYDDLGSETELDKCCRAHDNCKVMIPPMEEGYGLINTGSFPILSCDCEIAFRQCLSSSQSQALGHLYFQLTSRCIANRPPIKSCVERQPWYVFLLNSLFGDWNLPRCLSYSEDATQPSRWQIYDLPNYIYDSRLPIEGSPTREQSNQLE